MSGSLAIAAADFLAHKRALGRKYLAEEATLRLLLVFSEQQGLTELDELTTVFLDAFVASRRRTRARSFNNLVNIVGGFLEWTVVQQRLETSPLRRVHRRETDQRLPFLFDTMKARRLLEAAAALPDNARARTAAPPITPSSPSATDSGCELGKRAAFGSATSTSIVSCSLCVAANLERAVSFHTARSSATFSHARSSAAAGAPMTRCSASTADEVSIRVARARSSTGSS